MEFRISDTFTDSLTRLTGEEQKAVKTTAFDLQLNPANPGLRFHKLDRARDKKFWSVRVNRDVRLIVHKSDSSLLLCYVGHHDAAYGWAERRRIERHPKTGAAQLVEIRETVREIEIPRYVEAASASQPPAEKPELFGGVDDETLLGFGVPVEWLEDVRQATEDTLFDLAEYLPGEAAEALLELATGGTPVPSVLAATEADPFAHPDAQRRFRLVEDSEELERALAYPWEKWTVFLHPVQRATVERSYNGPARVAGSAGTGKTVVALHRAVHLARAHPQSRVLLTTFSDTLAGALQVKLERLIGSQPDVRERILVRAFDRVGLELHQAALGPSTLADAEMIRALLSEASQGAPAHRFTARFLETEWNDVVDAWQLDSWEAYRDVARIGRKTRLGEKQRELLWSIFERVRAGLAEKGLRTVPSIFREVTAHIRAGGGGPFDLVVIDEAQDIGVPHLRLLAALAGDRVDGLFFAGDLGQRIFQTPFSWRGLGVDVRGRSQTLRLNYRTSHQIRQQADRLLPPQLSDVDGNLETRRGTVSAFNGPAPTIRVLQSEAEEKDLVKDWLESRAAEGIPAEEIGVLVRSGAELERARKAVRAAGLEPCSVEGTSDLGSESVGVGTMHLAKGLEFRAVAVIACDDEVVPLQARIESVADEADLEDVYDTERHLLYVACTRARDHLLVTGVDPASEFLDDLQA